MNNKEETLCKHVEYNNIESVQRLLDQGNEPCVFTGKGPQIKIDFSSLFKVQTQQ